MPYSVCIGGEWELCLLAAGSSTRAQCIIVFIGDLDSIAIHDTGHFGTPYHIYFFPHFYVFRNGVSSSTRGRSDYYWSLTLLLGGWDERALKKLSLYRERVPGFIYEYTSQQILVTSTITYFVTAEQILFRMSNDTHSLSKTEFSAKSIAATLNSD